MINGGRLQQFWIQIFSMGTILHLLVFVTSYMAFLYWYHSLVPLSITWASNMISDPQINSSISSYPACSLVISAVPHPSVSSNYKNISTSYTNKHTLITSLQTQTSEDHTEIKQESNRNHTGTLIWLSDLQLTGKGWWHQEDQRLRDWLAWEHTTDTRP